MILRSNFFAMSNDDDEKNDPCGSHISSIQSLCVCVCVCVVGEKGKSLIE